MLANLLKLTGVLAIVAGVSTTAHAGAAQDEIIQHFASKAKAGERFDGFSADRGEALFKAKIGTGKPDTPSCTTCHSDSPFAAGKTRAGKVIEPMALSKTPDRYSDLDKVEKWFGRNCDSVIGRECTALEKGDFLTFMAGQ